MQQEGGTRRKTPSRSPQTALPSGRTGRGGSPSAGDLRVGPAALLALQRSAGNRAVTALIRSEGDGHLHRPTRPAGSPAAIQRAWAPVATTVKATLRTGPQTGRATRSASIPLGTAIVADRTQTQTQNRSVAPNLSFTRAANVRPPDWTIGQAAGAGYVLTSKLGTDKVYPDTSNRFVVPGRPGFVTERRWNDQIGEYIRIAPSPRGGGAEIVRTAAGYRSLVAPATLSAMSNDELLFVHETDLMEHLKAEIGRILAAEEARVGLPADSLNKPEHAWKQTISDTGFVKITGLVLVLNYEQAQGADGEGFLNWWRWKDGALTTLRTGARFLANSIEYWRRRLYRPDPTQVRVTDIRMTGSDLHERGLGAVIVDFSKPAGGSREFAHETVFTAVIKPEDRAVEKSLFGRQGTSLANRLNRLAGLGGADQLAQLRMATSRRYGALIEFIRGTAAEDFERNPQPPSQAIREAMVMAYVAGLADIHKENVIYVGGQPHLIDADNAFNNARLGMSEAPQAQPQSGFTYFSRTGEADERGRIRDDPSTSTSAIMRALVNQEHPVPIVDAVRKTFAGKSGRVVPVATASWASPLRNHYPRYRVGLNTDPPDRQTTRWALVKELASHVPTGVVEPQPGLRGETGSAPGGRGGPNFQEAAEAAEIKRDYDEGKIPFFNYTYDTGVVTHNGVDVWHGETLAEGLQKLLNRFPHQAGIADI